MRESMDSGRKVKLFVMSLAANVFMVAGFCLYVYFHPRYGNSISAIQSRLLFICPAVVAFDIAFLALSLRAAVDERARKFLIEMTLWNLLLFVLMWIGAFYFLDYLIQSSP
ncbi:MAG: hypothetical protein FWD77_00265 [Betaproteobacteria bacterium]|nr:hypothetical protein [Betaproteobacteria bacterium]